MFFEIDVTVFLVVINTDEKIILKFINKIWKCISVLSFAFVTSNVVGFPLYKFL